MKKIMMGDRLKGGVDAKNLGKYLKHFDPKEVKMGVKDEKEHTTNAKVAAEIASDHLSKEPHYYSKLKKAHIESTDVFNFNFFDILETNSEDEPIGGWSDKSKVTEPVKKETLKVQAVKKFKDITRAEKRAASPGHLLKQSQRLLQREKYKAEYTKMGMSPENIEASLSVFNTQKLGRDRPLTSQFRKERLFLFHGKDSNKLRGNTEDKIPFRKLDGK
jgi:Protein of unknown function (DUF5661)